MNFVDESIDMGKVTLIEVLPEKDRRDTLSLIGSFWQQMFRCEYIKWNNLRN